MSLENEYILTESDIDTLITWTNALGIPEFEFYVMEKLFNPKIGIPRRLDAFLKYKIPGISVSEAAVERCFSKHKRIHSEVRASLHASTVDDLLFIRYNTPINFITGHNDEEYSTEHEFLSLDPE